MYSLGRFKHHGNKYQQSFLVVPDSIVGTGFKNIALMRIHTSGLAEGDIYISESEIKYMDELETALELARMFYSLSLGWRKNKTRNEKRGYDIANAIRSKNQKLVEGVRQWLRSISSEQVQLRLRTSARKRAAQARKDRADADRRFMLTVKGQFDGKSFARAHAI